MPWVDMSQAAFMLGVSERTIRNWIKSGKMSARNIGGRREVEVPDPGDENASRAFAEEDDENGGVSLETQKRLEVALIECGRVKGTLASQERIMENLHSNIHELNAKLQKSERRIAMRTIYCVVIACLGVLGYILTKSFYENSLNLSATEHQTRITEINSTNSQKMEERVAEEQLKAEGLRDSLNKKRMEDLKTQEDKLSGLYNERISDLKETSGKMIAKLEEKVEKMRSETDLLRKEKMTVEAEFKSVQKDLELSESRRANAERQVELLRTQVQQLEQEKKDWEEGRRRR
jgi:excisionase family DNA binding protein